MHSENWRRILWFILKASMTGAAIAWMVFKIEWHAILHGLAFIRWEPVALSFFFYSAALCACAWRWKIVMERTGFPVSFTDSLRYYLIGSFFSGFLPTEKGGDFVRGILISRTFQYPFGAMIGTIVIERYIGMMVSFLIVFLASAGCVSVSIPIERVALSAGIVFCILFAGMCLLLNARFRKFLNRATSRIPLPSLHRSIAEVYSVMDRGLKQTRTIVDTIGLSLLNQSAHIVSAGIMGMAIHPFGAPWYSYFLVIPLSFIAQLLPSIGGFGVREAGFVLFFGWFHVSREPAVIFGILRLAFLISVSITGGVLFLLHKRRIPVST